MHYKDTCIQEVGSRWSLAHPPAASLLLSSSRVLPILHSCWGPKGVMRLCKASLISAPWFSWPSRRWLHLPTEYDIGCIFSWLLSLMPQQGCWTAMMRQIGGPSWPRAYAPSHPKLHCFIQCSFHTYPENYHSIWLKRDTHLAHTYLVEMLAKVGLKRAHGLSFRSQLRIPLFTPTVKEPWSYCS